MSVEGVQNVGETLSKMSESSDWSDLSDKSDWFVSPANAGGGWPRGGRCVQNGFIVAPSDLSDPSDLDWRSGLVSKMRVRPVQNAGCSGAVQNGCAILPGFILTSDY